MQSEGIIDFSKQIAREPTGDLSNPLDGNGADLLSLRFRCFGQTA